MSRRAPLPVEPARLEAHAAARAWRRVHPARTVEALEVWRDTSRSKPSVFRLTLASGEGVFAKSARPGALDVERTVYERVLPGVGVDRPLCFGFCEESDGRSWLFVEDVGNARPDVRDPAQQALTARWLATLHLVGAGFDHSRRLPSAGPERYLAHLRSAESAIEAALPKPALAPADREQLVTLLGHLRTVARDWPRVQDECAALPETLVHGDFRPKNLRMRMGPGGPSLVALDWETAGWGVPAIDLAPARGGGPQANLELYASIVRGRWPALTDAAVRRMAGLGRLLRTLCAVDWSSRGLVFHTERYLAKPLMDLDGYRVRLEACLANPGGEP